MKKICLLDVDMTQKGGVESVTALLAQHLSSYYQVYVISLCMKEQEWQYELGNHIIRVHFTCGNEEMRIRQMLVVNYKYIRRFLKQEGICTMLLMGTYMGLVGSLCCVGLRTKAIFCDHGALMNQWNDKTTRLLRYVSSKLSDYTVVLTDETKNDYIRKFHIKKIKRIYNAIDNKYLINNRSYDIESKTIVSVGRFGAEKGYDMLIEAAKVILSKHTDWKWDLYGTGETFEATKKKCEEYHLENQLVFKGQTSDMSQLYNQYSMLVLSSYREGLPLVLLEAKASGLPLVSFNVATGPKEIITDNVDGILVEPQNTLKLIEAVDSLIENEERRMEMANHSRENIEKFEINHIIEEWKQLIETI